MAGRADTSTGGVPAAAELAEDHSSERRALARLVVLADRCWCCRRKVRAIAGVVVDDGDAPKRNGFLALAAVDEQLVEIVDPGTLAARGIGPLRHRDSPGVLGGYLSNGCVHCGALIGRFLIEDLLADHLAGGGTLRQLDIGITVELRLPARPALGRPERRVFRATPDGRGDGPRR